MLTIGPMVCAVHAQVDDFWSGCVRPVCITTPGSRAARGAQLCGDEGPPSRHSLALGSGGLASVKFVSPVAFRLRGERACHHPQASIHAGRPRFDCLGFVEESAFTGGRWTPRAPDLRPSTPPDGWPCLARWRGARHPKVVSSRSGAWPTQRRGGGPATASSRPVRGRPELSMVPGSR